MIKVFVYGTLKRGYHNHILLKGSKFIGEAIIHDYGVFDLPFGFPGVKAHKGGFVVGEVYEVDNDTLISLDRLEGYYGENVPDNMYNKLEEIAILTNGDKVEVYFYEWNNIRPRGYDFIANGRWKR